MEDDKMKLTLSRRGVRSLLLSKDPEVLKEAKRALRPEAPTDDELKALEAGNSQFFSAERIKVLYKYLIHIMPDGDRPRRLQLAPKPRKNGVLCSRTEDS